MSDCQSIVLEAQIASFLNIDPDRITIDGSNIRIHCATDREMLDLQNKWCDISYYFSDRARYLFLHKDDYQSPGLDLDPRIWKFY